MFNDLDVQDKKQEHKTYKIIVNKAEAFYYIETFVSIFTAVGMKVKIIKF